MNATRQGDFMQLHSGKPYYPCDPRPEEVDIKDIAHALSMLCRYTGHCKRFYSVAEHSVHVSHLVASEHARQALLHDATEAYVADICRPLKPFLSNYAEIEQKNWLAIATRFNINPVLHPSIKEMDLKICLAEKAALMEEGVLPWGIEGPTPKVTIQAYYPPAAKALFLVRFNGLFTTR